MPHAKPKKPFLRPRNILLLTLATLAALIGYQVYLALTAKPGTAVDYAQKLEELVIANQPTPGGEDAWPIFQDAIARLAAAEERVWPQATRDSNNSGPVLDYSALYADRTNPTYDNTYTWEQVDARALAGLEVLRDEGVFDTLARAARAPRAVRPVPRGGRLIDIMLPELGKARALARAQAARMYLARQKGDEQEIAAAFEELLALGRITAQQPLLIDHLVGVAIVALATSHINDALVEHDLSTETCRALLAAMDRQLPLAPIAYAFEGERLGTLDIIQWTHTDDGRGSGRLIPSAVTSLVGTGGLAGGTGGGGGILDTLATYKIFNLAGLAFPSKAATTRKTTEFYDQIIAHSKLPLTERRNSTFNPDTWASRLSARHLLLRTLLPAFGKANQSRDQLEMQVAGARTLIALELHRARNGRYPDSLDALVPTILPALPTDPYSGKPLVYRPLRPDETPPDAVGDPYPNPSKDPKRPQPPRAFLLYSVGADGIDSGGHPAKQEWNALRMPAGAGSDYIINALRSRPAINPPPPPSAEPSTNP